MIKEKKKGKKKGEEKLLLLDVSALVFRAYFALPELTTTDGKPAGALYGFLSILLKTVRERKPTHIAAAIDLPGKTFRHERYEAYKATRPETPRDLKAQFAPVIEALEALGIPVLSAEGFEADDVIATVVRIAESEAPDVPIEIESGDQDLLQLVDDNVTVLAPGKGASDVRVMDTKAVLAKLGVPPNRVIDYKALRGDASDNIPGVRGVGPKTATALLTYAETLEDLIKLAKHPPANAPKELVRFADKLVAAQKDIFRDRDIVMLRDDAPTDFALSEARIERFPEPAFAALLKRWGFETLLSRFSQGGAIKPKVEQGSLDLEQEETLGEFIKAQEKQTAVEIETKVATGEFSEGIAQLERDIIPVITAMERKGILVDTGKLKELKKRFTKRQEDLAQKIFSAVRREFNLASPKQLAEALYDDLKLPASKRTKGGQRSTAAAVLEDLAQDHAVVKIVLEWREVSKLLSTYVDALPKLVADDKRIHARFWQLGTATGRIASSDPNLQNIPARTEDGRSVRDAFTAMKDAVFLSADYSQIELRVAAVLAQEDRMLEAFSRGEDIHSVTAQSVFRVDAEHVTAEMRRKAKVLNFGILYGMGARAVSKQMGVPLRDGKAFRDSYFEAFPALKTWIKRVVDDARQNGFTETAFGRKRFFPELQSEHQGFVAQAERAAMNAPVQGTAADLVKKGMVALAAEKAAPVILVQVHDELLFEVLETKCDAAARLVQEVLQSVWPEAPVAFPVVLRAGKRWGSLTPYEEHTGNSKS